MFKPLTMNEIVKIIDLILDKTRLKLREQTSRWRFPMRLKSASLTTAILLFTARGL
jgi:hypothetical protein